MKEWLKRVEVKPDENDVWNDDGRKVEPDTEEKIFQHWSGCNSGEVVQVKKKKNQPAQGVENEEQQHSLYKQQQIAFVILHTGESTKTEKNKNKKSCPWRAAFYEMLF